MSDKQTEVPCDSIYFMKIFKYYYGTSDNSLAWKLLIAKHYIYICKKRLVFMQMKRTIRK